MKKMFKDIFFGQTLNAETVLEMHYIQRTGSVETDELDDIDERPWHEDPMCGRLSCVDAAISSLPWHLIDKHWTWVTTLDLSRNHIQDPEFIVYFEKLQTLVLDHNKVAESVVFPRHETLTTLWLNFNAIGTLFPFADNLSHSFPKLLYLSMMGNPGAPSFVNDGKFHDYVMYRLYLVSRIPTLTYLDDRSVEKDEKEEAKTMYHTLSQQNLKGNPSDFTAFAAIETALNPHSSTSTEWLGQKLKSYWEAIKKSPL